MCSIIQCNVKSLTARGGMIPNKSLAEHPNIIGADLCEKVMKRTGAEIGGLTSAIGSMVK